MWVAPSTPLEGHASGEGRPDLFVAVRRAQPHRILSRPHQKPHAGEGVPFAHQAPRRDGDVEASGVVQPAADAIGDHKRGQSARAEHVRPVGRVLLRMMLHGSPNAKRDADDVPRLSSRRRRKLRRLRTRTTIPRRRLRQTLINSLRRCVGKRRRVLCARRRLDPRRRSSRFPHRTSCFRCSCTRRRTSPRLTRRVRAILSRLFGAGGIKQRRR